MNLHNYLAVNFVRLMVWARWKVVKYSFKSQRKYEEDVITNGVIDRPRPVCVESVVTEK